MDDFKRASMKDVSIGGWSCRCCGPKPGRDKDEHRRYARRRLAMQDLQDIRDDPAELESGFIDWPN
jgi:hypothetical protein